MDNKALMELPLFERALTLASVRHAGQKDKGGAPYVMHVIRVMMGVNSSDEKLAALLHDLLEDTETTEKELLEYGFAPHTVELVKLLSRAENEDYMDYIRRLSVEKSAVLIKLSDLKDNKDRTRQKEKLDKEDIERLKKYHRAEEFLLEVLHGHSI